MMLDKSWNGGDFDLLRHYHSNRSASLYLQWVNKWRIICYRLSAVSVKAIRLELGLTQEELAHKLGDSSPVAKAMSRVSQTKKKIPRSKLANLFPTV